MVFFLDHPGFIHRSLAGTQGKDSIGTYTDVEKWRKFSKTYAEDTSNISLLVSLGMSRINTGRFTKNERKKGTASCGERQLSCYPIC